MRGKTHNLLNPKISSYPKLSPYTFRAIANHGWMLNEDTKEVKDLGNRIDPKKVKEKDIIFLVSEKIEKFFKEIDPYIKAKYTLITSRSDLLIDESFEGYLNEKIISWWSVNSSSKMIYSIPLGLQNINWKFKNNPQSSPSLIDEVLF